MSLEIEIQKNTEAVLALTAALAAISLTQSAPKVSKAKAEKTEKVEAPAATPAPEPISTTDAAPAVEPVSTTDAAPAPAAEASPMPTLAHLQAEGKKLMDAGQQALLKSIVLANGGTKLSLLPESGYRATLKALKAAVAAL
jgi:hypothetical protein